VIEKHSLGGRQATVVFHLPATVKADHVWVVGDFNGSSLSSVPMTRGEGGFFAEICLETQRRYRFRYLLDDERWANDWAADDYVPNDFGGDDSVIDLFEPAAIHVSEEGFVR
jgi:1,4-alpha-glucan branching enzyme